MKATEFDYIVVGAGAHGLSSAFHLAQGQSSIALFEQFQILHTNGSSHGNSRTNRSAYDQEIYTKLSILGQQVYWPEAEKMLNEKLLYPNPYYKFIEPENVFQEYAKNCKSEDGFSFATIE